MENNPIIRAIMNPNRKELPGNPDPVELAESNKILARYTDAFHDGLRDWQLNPTKSMYDCIQRRVRETF